MKEILTHQDFQILHTNMQNNPDSLERGQPGLEWSRFFNGAKPCFSECQTLLMCLQQADLQKGLILELGTYLGRTANAIGVMLSALSPGSVLYTFDSFSGLPETWRPDFPAGTFALPESERPKLLPNVRQVLGTFAESLPAFLSQVEGCEGGREPTPISFLHIDCDLYSSTKEALQLLTGRIVPGTVLLFDEFYKYPGWENGEYKAFMELVKQNNWRYRFLCRNVYHEAVGVQIIH
ncbi:MAG: class I SAM-dependent methyltransferase [Candidatus Obscuribacter sp.]|nr:class I SAM-dependent methyltransferase [Candidatus Melainabacteria bacterium]MDX1985705.1 class I SAM-dependent methyltransferase [Candidatus Obscuribacter sp.]